MKRMACVLSKISLPFYISYNVESDTPSAQFPITALREIKLLKLLSHPNILRLEDMAVEHPSRPSEFTFEPFVYLKPSAVHAPMEREGP
jgi:serine/threonine protein kinase